MRNRKNSPALTNALERIYWSRKIPAMRARKGLGEHMNALETKKSHRLLRVLAVAGVVLLLLTGLNFFCQTVWAHRHPAFHPEGEPVELAPLLEQGERSREDYDLIFSQTGLSQWAVEELLRKEDGVRTILAAQEAFFDPVEAECVTLLFGRFTCEDLLRDESGEPLYSAPLAPFRPGDILVSFSTHSVGWRHGHAGLVVDAGEGITLEAVQLGVNTYRGWAERWRNYSNFMVLRVKDKTDEERQQVVDFALKRLNDVPYSLLSGVFGPKDQAGREEYKVQCAYLPWLAWQSAGVDLDGDGGKIVTVRDLAESGEVEVVQVYGMDPALLADRQVRG